MALFPSHHLHSLHLHKIHRPNVVVLLGSRRTGRGMHHKIAQITSKINELLPQFSKVVSLKNFAPTNKCPPKKQRFVTFLMQGQAIPMMLTEEEVSTPMMEAMIERLNEESENDSGLKLPLPVEQLDWETFGAMTGLGPRVVTHTKRLLLKLHPKSLRQQVYMTCEVIAEDNIIKLRARWSVVGALMGTTDDCVRSMYRNYRERSGNSKPGRPRLLTDEQALQVFEEVTRKTLEKHPMTRKDLSRYIKSEWGVDVSKKTIHRLVKEHPELSPGVAMPMERMRAEVTREELVQFYDQLRVIVDGVLPESVVNLDEVGFSRRARGSPLPCVIPSQLQESKIEYVPQDELDSTTTLLAAVTLAGEALLPYIVTPVKSLPNEFLTQATWMGRDCVLDFSSSGFANGRVINQWYEKVFRPWCERHRRNIDNPHAPIVLICDGFSGHTNDDLKAMAATDNVRLMFLPAHSSHLTQALDKFVFAIMKRDYNVIDSQVADRNGRKIDRILKAFYGTCTSPLTIRASWKAIGIIGLHDASGQSLGIHVDGTNIINRHVEMAPEAGYQRKRHRIQQDYLGNRQALEMVEQGRCPHCGQPLRPPQPPGALPVPQFQQAGGTQGYTPSIHT